MSECNCHHEPAFVTEKLREDVVAVLWASWWTHRREPWHQALLKRPAVELDLYREQADAVLRKVAEHTRKGTFMNLSDASSEEPTIDDLETAMGVLLWLHIEEDNGLLRDHISIVRSALDSIITAREAAEARGEPK